VSRKATASDRAPRAADRGRDVDWPRRRSLRLLCLDRSLADAEPKTLRYRLLHTAARIVRSQRKRKIKIPKTWAWARGPTSSPPPSTLRSPWPHHRDQHPHEPRP
jgi:hypothetical protein